MNWEIGNLFCFWCVFLTFKWRNKDITHFKVRYKSLTDICYNSKKNLLKIRNTIDFFLFQRFVVSYFILVPIQLSSLTQLTCAHTSIPIWSLDWKEWRHVTSCPVTSHKKNSFPARALFLIFFYQTVLCLHPII